MEDQNIIWKQKPSQVENIGIYLACMFIIPIPWAIYASLKTATTTYTLTPERLVYERGILSRKCDEIELYRVKDYQVVVPFIYRIFGVSNLVLHTSDKTSPIFKMSGVVDGEIVKEHIRKHVEFQRRAKGVRELD